MLTDEDLQFELTVQPNLSAVEEGLKKVAADIDKTGKKGGQSMTDKLSAALGGGDDKNSATNILLGGILGGQGAGHVAGQLGGMVGEAFGGPIGAEIGSQLGEMAVGAMKKTIAVPAKMVAGGLNLLKDSLQGLQGELGPIVVGFDLMTAGVSKFGDTVKSIPLVGEVLGPAVDAMAAVPSTLNAITETLTNLAAKASPATFTLFQHAVEDSQAVIGHRFVPVLEMMTDGVRLFADVVQTFLPTGEQVRAALQDVRTVMDELRESLGEAAGAVGPMIRSLLVTNIRALGATIYLAVKPLQIFIEGLNVLQRTLTDLTGINFGGGGLESSFGAAARTARFSSADSYLEQLQLGAYSQNLGPTQAQVPSLVQNINDMLRDWTRQWDLDQVMRRVREMIPNPLNLLPGGGGGGNGGAFNLGGAAAGNGGAGAFNLGAAAAGG